jgi:ATP-dependent DNA helicase RecG
MRAAIRSILEEHGSVTTTEVIRQTGRSRATAMKYIRQMIDEGILEPMEPVGSTKQRYRLSTT